MRKTDADLIEKFDFKLYDTVEVESIVFNTKSRGFLLYLLTNAGENMYGAVQFICNKQAITEKEVIVKSCKMVLLEKQVIKKMRESISSFSLWRDRTGI